MAEPNFAVNQKIWDTSPPLAMCERKGAEHRAYGWARQVLDWWTEAQREAYLKGYNSEDAS